MTAYGVLKKYGWTQDRYGNEDVGYCILGAIMRAYQDIDIRMKMTGRVKHLLPHSYKEKIVAWNDAKSRTESQVLALVKKARV